MSRLIWAQANQQAVSQIMSLSCAEYYKLLWVWPFTYGFDPLHMLPTLVDIKQRWSHIIISHPSVLLHMLEGARLLFHHALRVANLFILILTCLNGCYTTHSTPFALHHTHKTPLHTLYNAKPSLKHYTSTHHYTVHTIQQQHTPLHTLHNSKHIAKHWTQHITTHPIQRITTH